ncbi:MAG: tetratricopeptide repeat protein [Deinococcales bacterium]
MSREGTVPEKRFVVEVREPVPGDSVGEIAAVIAGRFGMDPGRVRKLLDGRTGPVTKPVLQEKANLIAQAFAEAGVAVSVRPADADRPAVADGGRLDVAAATAGPQLRGEGDATPSTMFLSSTRWVPSPHEEPDVDALAQGSLTERPSDEQAPQRETAPTPRPRSSGGPPASRGLGLRGYLLIGFTASLVLLLALQAINGMEAGRAHPPASMAAGMAAYNDGDFAQARRLWTPLAQAGDPRAQYMLGYMAENGQGRPWSNHDAAAWYRLAANQDYPQAQLALGKLYARGMGVPRDASQAAAYYEQAARVGYGPAQFQYALALFHGSGVKQDFAQALRWFEAAAHNGVPEARPYVTFAGSALHGGSGSVPGSGQAGAAEQNR